VEYEVGKADSQVLFEIRDAAAIGPGFVEFRAFANNGGDAILKSPHENPDHNCTVFCDQSVVSGVSVPPERRNSIYLTFHLSRRRIESARVKGIMRNSAVPVFDLAKDPID
jgi:hypothetical protein